MAAMSLDELAKAIRSGAASSFELTQDAIKKAKNSQSLINAFIAIEEPEALEAAKAADKARHSGQPLGPLHGIPLAHKDMFDRKGMVTGCGSRIRKDHVAQKTSTVMERLERAGAISIGRLNMSEFALGPTGDNAHFGRARNPVDPDLITGGSSSGSGAAVSAGIVPAALGSDTGGSIRLPAACCGTVGIKPTQGRVSRFGAMPLSFSQDCVGPLARTVDDAYQILQCISGPDGKDPSCAAIDKPANLTNEISDLRVGSPGGFFENGIDHEVALGVETALKAVEPFVAKVATAKLPDISEVPELANIVAIAEAGTFHYDWMRDRADDYGPQVRMRLSQSMAIPSPVYLRALQKRAVMLGAFLAVAFKEADVLIVPAMPFPAPLSADVDVGASPEMNRIVSAITRFTRPFSFLGLPVVTIPVAHSGKGLPIAIQIVGKPWEEQKICSLARTLQKVLALKPFVST